MAEKDQQFVEMVAKALVEKPDAVKVDRKVDEMGVLLELSVDKEDMGVIIGKEGRTAKALRTLLRVLGAKNDARVNLKIVEPEGSEAPVKEEKKEEKTEEPKEEAKAEEKEAEAEVKEEEAADEDDRPMADLEI
ncbi:MAG: KH domain-containing protein [Patescibacteria group bacterium]|nr:KH domain-containing protein [Patescibacteria group bacterium]